MKVSYNNIQVKDGNYITPIDASLQPAVDYTMDLEENKVYTLIMHDPDAPAGNHLHWILVNISLSDETNLGETLLEYKGPSPPKGSGTHRYIFLLLEQERKHEDIKSIPINDSNRVMPMDDVFAMLHVKPPAISRSRVYFTSSNDTKGGSKRRRKSPHKKRVSKRRKTQRKRNK